MTRALLLLLFLCSSASAQVRIIAPFPPGGPIDTLARLVGEKYHARTGQAVVVDNRPGGAGNIGILAVAQAPADGKTWLFVPQGNITINATMMKDMPFNWERDFAPVTLLAYAPNILAVNNNIPAKNIRELIAYAKANPGKLSYGSPGIGSSLHLIGELMKREAGIDIVHVPYKGTTQAMTDLLGGQIGMMFGSAPTIMPQAKAGKLRALAVTTAKRSPAAPELPTLTESGIKMDVPSWYGALVPAKTPPDTVQKLYADLSKVLDELKVPLEAQGLYPVGNTPAQFAAQIKSETALWARVIQEAGIKPQ